MKKLILCFSCILAIILLSGCSLSNTPTKKVENFLDNYKNQDESVLTQLKDMVDMDTLMDDDQKTTYSDIMKKQYQDLTYDIKNETIDGDTATVTAEIEVYDYYKINKEAEDYYNSNPDEFKATTGTLNDVTEAAEDVVEGAKGAVEGAIDGAKNGANNNTTTTGDSKYVEYRLNKLKDAKDRVKYTIDFTLTKINDVWTLNDIDDIARQKIHGLYEH